MAQVTETVPRKKKRYLRRIAHNAALSRWESVKREEQIWLRPFKELPIDRAIAYLEDLRKITEKAGHILNDRISEDKKRMVCAGPGCGISVEGLNSSGRPKWIAKMDFKDRKNPEIIRSLYFHSMECHNAYIKKHGGAYGGTGQ